MQRVLAILAVLLLGACAAPIPSVPPATERPTDSGVATAGAPTSPSSPATTPPPTPGPSLLIEHATGSTDVVLRMWASGGFLYPGTTVDLPPAFTLYGEGRAIYTIERPLANGGLRRELHQAQLDEEQVAALLSFALDQGGLATARESYSDVPIADATTTNFEIHAGGVDKTVAVYALGDYEEPGPDAPARSAFDALAQVLHGFGAEVAAGNATDLGPYQPEAYRVTLFPDDLGELQPTAEWPWEELEPSDFEPDNSGFRIANLDAEHGSRVAELPVGDFGDPVVMGPDDNLYLVRARPLLPDEMP